jgi:hypothetical protein
MKDLKECAGGRRNKLNWEPVPGKAKISIMGGTTF